jgi:hypothetical protein
MEVLIEKEEGRSQNLLEQVAAAFIVEPRRDELPWQLRTKVAQRERIRLVRRVTVLRSGF